MPDPAWLICSLYSETEHIDAGARLVGTCDECEEAIWVTPAAEEAIETGGAFLLICTQCAAKGEPRQRPMTGQERKLAQIHRLTAQAEAAYDKMYDLHNEREIKWEYENAYDSLRSAARLARELGLNEDADAHEKRAVHIRKVYRHQFMIPPDLSA